MIQKKTIIMNTRIRIILLCIIIAITSCTNESLIIQEPEQNSIPIEKQIATLAKEYGVEDYIKINKEALQKHSTNNDILKRAERFIKLVADLQKNGELIVKSNNTVPKTRFWMDSWGGEAISRDFKAYISVSWGSNDDYGSHSRVEIGTIDVMILQPGNFYFDSLGYIPNQFYNSATRILEYSTSGMIYEQLEQDIMYWGLIDISGWIDTMNIQGEARIFWRH